MKSIKPAVKKLLKRCIPTLKAKKRNARPTVIEHGPANDLPSTFELPLAAVQVVPVSIGMPVPSIPSQRFERFFLEFNQPADLPVVAHLVAPELVPATPMAAEPHTPLERPLKDVALENSTVGKLEVDAVIENCILRRRLAQMTRKLQDEIDTNGYNQTVIDTQESIIHEYEDATHLLESDLEAEKLRTAGLEIDAVKLSDTLKETIRTKDEEIEKLRSQLAERDEVQKNQANNGERHDIVERQPVAYTIKDITDLKKKLRTKIAAKTALETKLSQTEAERTEAIARCKEQAEAARLERDRLLEQCQKLERKVASLVDTLGIYDVSEPWVKCFESGDGREALDNIIFAKFLTPFKCTSGENPNAMRLSELGPSRISSPGAVAQKPRSKGLRNAITATPTPASRIRKPTQTSRSTAKDLADLEASRNGAIVANALPTWTLPIPSRGAKSREVEL